MIILNPVKFMGFVAGTSLFASYCLLSNPAHSAEISYQYSKLDEGSCMSLIVNEEEGYSEQVCKGVDGIAVFVAEGDLRMSVAYRNQAATDRYFTFGGFNRVGDVVEWRLSDEEGYAKPYATILRWYVSVGEPKDKQALVVSKIADDDFCIAGFVDASANKNANELARSIADGVARSFVCGQDKPQWYGETGVLATALLQ
ncbi:hypothetical protein [Cohaesibacter celericrescens]|uniref:Uncharacterized protein n=1 Tax=Cohaesibacter celericrescens TaxID=2067669 RepID=A0A2N5XP32_9HYPH|nr:hypothetical protein [Cohaesibacter celericrescens]PLW76301.1 hypothetical protein C0081_15520 [Cohaesibacter celericrescens]